jgi:hypothetical protein
VQEPQFCAIDASLRLTIRAAQIRLAWAWSPIAYGHADPQVIGIRTWDQLRQPGRRSRCAGQAIWPASAAWLHRTLPVTARRRTAAASSACRASRLTFDDPVVPFPGAIGAAMSEVF